MIFTIGDEFFAPIGEGLDGGDELLTKVGEGVFYFGRDLIVGFAMDDTIAGKLFELFGEGGVGDVELAEEFVEA